MGRKQTFFCLLIFWFVAILTGLIFANYLAMMLLVALFLVLVAFTVLVRQEIMPPSSLWFITGVMVCLMLVAGWQMVHVSKTQSVQTTTNTTSISQKTNTKNPSLSKPIPILQGIDIKTTLFLSLLIGLLFLLLCAKVGLMRDETDNDEDSSQSTELPSGHNAQIDAQIKEYEIQVKGYKKQIMEYEAQIQTLTTDLTQLSHQYEHAKGQLDGIEAFLYEDDFDKYDVNVMLSERLQKVYHDFVMADHQTLEENLLAYNRLCMYIALIKDKTYPDIFANVKDMTFDDMTQEAQFMQLDNQALYKQICWLLLTLRRSYNDGSQTLLNQIKQNIDQISHASTQREMWQALQQQDPKIIVRIQGGNAYVL